MYKNWYNHNQEKVCLLLTSNLMRTYNISNMLKVKSLKVTNSCYLQNIQQFPWNPFHIFQISTKPLGKYKLLQQIQTLGYI